jgi:hypothetical protein
MSNRSIDAFARAHESLEKFDYFICGVGGALFAYLGQHYLPKKFELGPSAFEPLALVLLATSFFVGLKRVEVINYLMQLNAQMLDAAEQAGGRLQALVQGPGPYFNSVGGEVTDRQTVESERVEYLQFKEAIEKKLTEGRAKAIKLYHIRNTFLVLGFVSIFLAKVLQPYFP